MNRQQVNVDLLVKDFFEFYDMIDVITKENDQIKEEMNISDKRIYCYGVTEQNTKEEIEKLQELIQNYQKMLVDYNSTKEEISGLKNSLDDLAKTKQGLEKELIWNKENHMQQLHDLQEAHRNEVQRIQQQSNDLASSEISVYEAKVDDHLKEISFLKQELKEADKKHHSEMNRIKLEYDSKLQKFQLRQVAQANNSAGSISARNDIFRKKLQHLQMESEKELRSLRARCTEQQQEIEKQQHMYKLQNKTFQDQTKEQQEQVRQQEKLIRQSQSEIRRLQAMLKEEKENSIVFKNDVVLLQKKIDEYQQQPNPKRRKSMFNPNNNRLDVPLN